MKEIIVSLPDDEISRKLIIPDQVLTKSEVDYEEMEAVMAGCPGYEYLNEPSPPNWPPKRGIIHNLRELLSEVSFAVKHPHAHKAFKKIERERRR